MPLVKVKNKYQVTLPTAVRQRAGVTVGDLLEAKADKGKITLTPKVVVDRAFIEKRPPRFEGRDGSSPTKGSHDREGEGDEAERWPDGRERAAESTRGR